MTEHNFSEARKTGRTTRLIDSFVQDLFNNGFCYVTDHITREEVKDRFTEMNMKTLLRRISTEHGLSVGEGLEKQGNKLILTK